MVLAYHQLQLPVMGVSHLGHAGSKLLNDYGHSQHRITTAQQTPNKSYLVKPPPNSTAMKVWPRKWWVCHTIMFGVFCYAKHCWPFPKLPTNNKLTFGYAFQLTKCNHIISFNFSKYYVKHVISISCRDWDKCLISQLRLRSLSSYSHGLQHCANSQMQWNILSG